MAVARRSRERSSFLDDIKSRLGVGPRRAPAADPRIGRDDFRRMESAISAATAALGARQAWTESLSNVDAIIRLFSAAASDVPGVERVLARTSGPFVRLIVVTNGRPWADVVDELEPKLRPLYVGGMSSFEYDVADGAGGSLGSGFQPVFDRATDRARQPVLVG